MLTAPETLMATPIGNNVSLAHSLPLAVGTLVTRPAEAATNMADVVSRNEMTGVAAEEAVAPTFGSEARPAVGAVVPARLNLGL